MTIIQFLLADLAGLLAIVGLSRAMAALLGFIIRYIEER
jgi:hypothetical protein